jgi:hypothetical protein
LSLGTWAEKIHTSLFVSKGLSARQLQVVTSYMATYYSRAHKLIVHQMKAEFLLMT